MLHDTGIRIPISREYLNDWYEPVGEPDENGNQLWMSHAAIALEQAFAKYAQGKAAGDGPASVPRLP